MTNEEAIKYLKQLYPYGGHCWLDEQRIEAIGIAITAIERMREAVTTDLEQAAKDAWADYEYRDTPGRLYHSCFEDAFALGARWMQEQMMREAVTTTVIQNDADDGDVAYVTIPNRQLNQGDKVKIIISNQA